MLSYTSFYVFLNGFTQPRATRQLSQNVNTSKIVVPSPAITLVVVYAMLYTTFMLLLYRIYTKTHKSGWYPGSGLGFHYLFHLYLIFTYLCSSHFNSKIAKIIQKYRLKPCYWFQTHIHAYLANSTQTRKHMSLC